MPRGIVKNERPKTGPTAGYPEIERLIDTEDFSEVNKQFQEAYDKLDEIAKHKRGLKKSREARKAMKAIELTMDLFRELLTIKYRLQDIAAQKQTKTPPTT
jgi:hypothetical protein